MGALGIAILVFLTFAAAFILGTLYGKAVEARIIADAIEAKEYAQQTEQQILAWIKNHIKL